MTDVSLLSLTECLLKICRVPGLIIMFETWSEFSIVVMVVGINGNYCGTITLDH